MAGNLLGGLLGAYPSAILSDVTTAEERPTGLACSADQGLAFLLGLFLGGVLSDIFRPLVPVSFFRPFSFGRPYPLVSLLPQPPHHKQGRQHRQRQDGPSGRQVCLYPAPGVPSAGLFFPGISSRRALHLILGCFAGVASAV